MLMENLKFIIKRDGSKVHFNEEKIKIAIWKAVQSVNGTDKQKSDNISTQIIEKIKNTYKNNTPTVEEIQDTIEEYLIKGGYDKVAKSYILYRHQHEINRLKNHILTDFEIIDSYIEQEDWRIKENSNMAYSLQGLRNHISSNLVSNYWLMKIYPPEIGNAHKNGNIHIHDLSELSVYCFSGETKIPLLNGEVLTMKELTKKYKNKTFEVYSIDKNNNIVSGTAYNPRKTRKNAEVIEVILDNNEKIICTPDHPFLLRNGKYKKAINLFEGESLMPLYTYKNYRNTEYLGIYNPSTNKKEYLHRQLLNADKNQHCHHINGNKKDNRIENIKLLNTSIHRGLELKKTMKKDKWINSNKKTLIKRNKTIEMRNISTNNTIKRNKTIRQRGINSFTHSKIQKKINKNKYLDYIDKNGYISVKDFLKIKNHKVKSIKILNKKIDVYDISVKKYHNFALESGVFVHNCVGWDLRQLLVEGFTGVRGKISSKPPKHFRTALGQIVNFIYTLQGEAAGAQAFSNFDTLLAPFIRHDNLNKKEVKQALQEFIFNMNIPTRVGFQTPFSNLTMDLTIPNNMKDLPVIIGGKIIDNIYGDYQEEVEMLNEIFAEVMMEGDSKGRIFTFPIPTYNITKKFNWENPKYKNIWKMTAKYGIPYFANFVNSDLSEEDARSMCPLDANEELLIKSKKGNLIKSKIQTIYNNYDEIEVYSDGIFRKGKINKFNNQELIEVKLKNGHKIKMTTHHLNYVIKDYKGKKIETIMGEKLAPGMWLPYSTNAFEGEGGTYELGYIIGACAGDGTIDDTYVTFSLNNSTKQKTLKNIISFYTQYFPKNHKIISYPDSKLISLVIKSKGLVGYCKEFINGIKTNKTYTSRLFSMSKEFREGVLQGHMDTDGGNRNRIYTSSEKMVKALNMLATTLGTTTSIMEDNREGRYSENTNYSVLFYQLKRKEYKNVFFTYDNKIWIQILSITPVSGRVGYCVEINDEKTPIFTIANTGILTHNCRLRLDNRELRKRGGGLFGSSPMTGSIGVVTINMPRIGYLAKNEEDFFEKLKKEMGLAKESLIIKRKYLEKYTEMGLYPYSKHYLRGLKEQNGAYWKNHFSTIGLIGMNEAIKNFLDTNITTKEGLEFSKKILNFMRDKIQEYQEETGDLFNLEATPGEGTAYRLAKIDKTMYPKIKTGNEKTETVYYTNSSQLPVGYTDDLFKALENQNQLQPLYTGGTVFHAFIGEKIVDIEALKLLLKKVTENYEIPYFSITPTFSICPIHGYIAGEHIYCPICANE
jgi:anaerobic ribonucleoside-triphosphate reductase